MCLRDWWLLPSRSYQPQTVHDRGGTDTTIEALVHYQVPADFANGIHGNSVDSGLASLFAALFRSGSTKHQGMELGSPEVSCVSLCRVF